ncbi:hypothetical protein Hanom_Chr02g00121991 [Helianthus anomalus]
MNRFGLAKVSQPELSCRAFGSDPDLDVFRAFYKLNLTGNWYTFEVRDKRAMCFSWITTSMKDWKDHLFLVDNHCVPVEMAWRSRRSALPGALPEGFVYKQILYTSPIREAGRIQKLPEHILVTGKISTIWPKPDYFPMIRWNRAGYYGLKDALRLKSFKVPEFKIRASKTKEGKPYLEVVNEGLYQILDHTPTEGKVGSGSNPSERVVNVSPISSASVVVSNNGTL